MITDELRIRVDEKVKDVLAKAKALFQYNEPMPAISYQLKGVVAGYAYLRTNKITLNPVLLSENQDAFINQTVVHEIAHLIAYKIYGSRGHDKQWKRVMTHLGVEPKRCHNYNLKSVSKRYEYKCSCMYHFLSTVMHNRIQVQKRLYRCNKCHHDIVCVDDNYLVANNSEKTIKSSDPKPLTKKQQVKQIIESNPLKTKAELVQLIMEQLSTSKSNASVYLYNYNKSVV